MEYSKRLQKKQGLFRVLEKSSDFRHEEIFSEEKKNLDLNKNIKLELKNYKDSFTLKRFNDNSYIIGISDDDQRDEKLFRKTVKHELYHIFKGDCDKEEFTILEGFWKETRARLYENYSIKL